MGYILLEGGAEFGGQMTVPDQRALELAGGLSARLSIIPTAAAPDNNHQRAAQNGIRWFHRLGASNVTALPLLDRESADDPSIVEALGKSQLIYMLGGFPHHLEYSLTGSKGWQAMVAAHKRGAVIAGSSAGAMILCDHYYDPYEKKIFKGLRLVSGICILPHHNDFGHRWAPQLAQLLPDTVLIGIDEETGMLNDGPQGRWQVYGGGMVTLYRDDQIANFKSGAIIDLKS
jgi:cyanophycinase